MHVVNNCTNLPTTTALLDHGSSNVWTSAELESAGMMVARGNGNDVSLIGTVSTTCTGVVTLSFSGSWFRAQVPSLSTSAAVHVVAQAKEVTVSSRFYAHSTGSCEVAFIDAYLCATHLDPRPSPYWHERRRLAVSPPPPPPPPSPHFF